MVGPGGHKYSQGNEKLQKAARGLGPCAGHLGLLTGTYLGWAPTLPERLGDRALTSGKNRLGQTLNYFAGLQFSQPGM